MRKWEAIICMLYRLSQRTDNKEALNVIRKAMQASAQIDKILTEWYGFQQPNESLIDEYYLDFINYLHFNNFGQAIDSIVVLAQDILACVACLKAVHPELNVDADCKHCLFAKLAGCCRDYNSLFHYTYDLLTELYRYVDSFR